MSELKNTLRISAPISPYDSRDTYPTHFEEYGHGGYRSVNDIPERDAIPKLRRKQGMLVYVKSEEKWYILQTGITNDDWVEFGEAIGLLSNAQLVVDTIEPFEPTAKTIWLNPVTRVFQFRDPGNSYWQVLNITIIDGGEF